MLQPSQLRDVAVRFSGEVAEVRAFLQGANVRVDTPDALRQVADRIATDRGFHRDLGSHAWMLLFGGAPVPDALRVLVLAALGPRFAADADEDDAHAILRFVMESRHALAETSRTHATSESSDAPVIDAAPVASSAKVDVPRRTGELGAPTVAFQPGTLRSITPAIAAEDPIVEDALPSRHRVAASEPSRSGRWSLLAACLLVAVSATWWFVRKPVADTAATGRPAPVVEGTDLASKPSGVAETPVAAPAMPALPQTTGSKGPTVVDRASAKQLVTKPSATGPRWIAPQPQRQSYPVATAALPTVARTTPATPLAVPAPITRVVASNSTATTPSPLVRPASAAPKAAAAPLPASVLSGRLDSPSPNTADAVDDRVDGTRGYPRLLRRKPLDTGTLVAKASPAPGTSVPTRPVPNGTVRSTSLGISAGNLVYAPEPPYPAAAAQQHISGQVTVQAMIDRDGNVASARVVSGPPLLRDAAVSAVQQWRYRPFTAGGKPQTFTATAVMEFQLQ